MWKLLESRSGPACLLLGEGTYMSRLHAHRLRAVGCLIAATAFGFAVPMRAAGASVSASNSSTASVAALVAPQNVDTAPEATGELTVTWSPVLGAVSYDIFRGLHGGPLSLVGNTTKRLFMDSGLTAGQEYDYAVAASDGTNDGPQSDIASGTPYDCTQVGTNGNDTVDITTDDTVYCGLGGNDTITVDAANVVVLGGPGSDHITGGSQGPATIDGGTGSDVLTAGPDGDTINGNSGNDKIVGGSGADDLNGDSGNDHITGSGGNDVISGGAGNDNLSGGTGDDNVDGGSGNDAISGGDGNDTLTGDSGNDHIQGGTGNDLVQGDDGNDVVNGGTGNDVVEGGTGNDNVQGGTGDDVVQGDDGNDVVNGGPGNDVDSGGTGNDTVRAGGGNDIVDGGDGADTVDCGTGTVQVVTDNSDTDSSDCQNDVADSTTQSFRGTVVTYTAGVSIVVDTGNGQQTINIDAQTRVEVDGNGTPQVGDKVEVEADTSTNPPLALSIHAEVPQGN
jgi:Ca2+-binding RTX toxin-like protein